MAALDESILSASSYNQLPSINEMNDAPAKFAAPLKQLLRLIQEYGVETLFSVHLLHKHFDCPDNHVMVYSTETEPNGPTFMLFTPKLPQQLDHMRGLYFRAQPGGKMVAYEYTTDLGEDVSMHDDFVRAFSEACFKLNVQDVFALTVRKPFRNTFHEIEWEAAGSTILLPDSVWSPTKSDPSGALTTMTDWVAPLGGGPPIVEFKCTQTRSGTHINVTCSRTRGGSHIGHSAGPTSEPTYTLDGDRVSEGTDLFTILNKAHQLVACY